MYKPTLTFRTHKPVRMQMRTHSETTPSVRVAQITAALVLTVVLGACGGGGGGSSPAVRPDSSYPTLSNASFTDANGGITSNYSFDGSALTQLPPPGAQVTALVNLTPETIILTVTGFESTPFSFTIQTTAGTNLPLANSPLGSLTPSCANCLLAGTATATDGKTVSFMYIDPAAAGLTYSTLGLWSKPSATLGITEFGAAFSIGVVTRAADLPASGTATYNGFMAGRYTDGTDTYAVGANATAVANFSPGPSSAVAFSTSNTHIAKETGGSLVLAAPVPKPSLDLHGNLIDPAGINSLTGTLLTPGGALTGPATAQYYGPPTGAALTPAEFGGAFFVGNGTEQMNGSFALKK